ncbi:type VII secretion protein EsaA [Streptococcus cuniculi]|uniref:Type VII secretion system accessory factor EsaA n=1 Tax=Streptococcus cuniculi TaxID=1432788 RepID=A0A4Y9JCE7_9STRE|nr:type VII secretion protein EsaA [Streptococcus cuniculi]MBF0777462.1 type VII secretion protein EsaA [Streptococcus cuniculi]TFU98517.1 type VII secretion protein EsaA [Streptococcus cuniculi]
MKKIFSKGTAFILALLLLITLSGALIYSNLSMKEEKKVEKPTIALVNEDVASDFNGQSYNFGKSFVSLVSDDPNYDWQVVSRSVADRAYEEQSVDAVVYIPNSFSKDILTLQELSPTQAKIDYKIQQQSDNVSEIALKGKVVDLLYDFNKSVIKMYYASIANNLSEAEGQLNGALGKHESLVTGLTNNVDAPFKSTYPRYDTFINGTNRLKSINSLNVTAQNTFTDSTTKLLSETGKNLSDQLPAIEAYANLQKQISEINVRNANEAIEMQATRDEEFYRQHFDILQQTIYSKLGAVNSRIGDNGVDTGGLLGELHSKVTDYNKMMQKTKGNIDNYSKTLKEKRETLLSLEKDVYQKFFNQTIDPTVENFDFSNLETDDNARAGLASIIKKSFEDTDNIDKSAYTEKLKSLIGGISVNSTDYKLDELVAHQSLTPERRDQYVSELHLIERYAAAFEIPTGNVNVELQEVPGDEETEQKFSQTINVHVPAKTTYVSSAIPKKYVVEVLGDVEGGEVKRSSVSLNNQTENDVTYTINITGTLEKDSTSDSFELSWKDTNKKVEVSKTSVSFTLVPRDKSTNYYKYVAVDHFSDLLQLFNQIDVIANTVTLLYGEPGADYTSLSQATTAKDFKEHSSSSIVALYGNMDRENIAKRLHNDDVVAYKESGEGSIDKIVATIQSLNTVITGLEKDSKLLSENMPESYFASTVQSMQLWYEQTMSQVEDEYKKWKKAEYSQLTVRPWSGVNSSNEKDLYVDDSSALYNQLQTMIRNTAQVVETTTQSSQTVQDNSKEFDTLVENATTIQTEAQDILTSADSLTTTGNIDVVSNKGYAENFSKILANTRTQGVNKDHLYTFFANPIISENITPTQKIAAPKATDYRWILTFLVGLALGIVLMMGMARLSKQGSQN